MSELSSSPAAEEEAQTPQAKSVGTKGEFWFSVYECIEGKPKIDFEKLAERCNYKNAATARVMYNNKRKAVLQSNGVIPMPTTSATKPKRGRKPKEETLDESPKKRKRGRPPKKKEVEVEVSVKDEDSEVDTEFENESYHY